MATRQSYTQHGRQSYAPTSYASRNSAAAGSSAPRASTFPVPSSDYLNSIEECVKATEGCASTVSMVVDVYANGVACDRSGVPCNDNVERRGTSLRFAR